MTPATLRVLTRLLDGDRLVRDRRGFHVGHPAGIGRELVSGALAQTLIRDGLVEVEEKTAERAVYAITAAGRAELETS